MEGGVIARELTLWEHLNELVRRLRVIFIAVVISSLFMMIFPVSLDIIPNSVNPWYPTPTTFVIRKLQQDFLPAGVTVIPISLFAPIEVYIVVSLMLGILVSLPVIAYELYRFIYPALHENEKKLINIFILSFLVLFAAGFSIGYFFVTPASIRVLLLFSQFVGLPSIYGFTEILWLVVGSLLVCGFILTLPIYVNLLVRAGILKTQTVTKNRRYIYPLIIIGIALIDPDPTVITETLIGLPLIILIEVSIIISKRFEKTRLK